MSRRRLPKPTQRKGSHTWEIRARVGGKIATRTLGTQDYNIALRRLPQIYEQLLQEAEARSRRTVNGAAGAAAAPQASAGAKRLPVSEACQRYREYILTCERSFRLENGIARRLDPIKLAADYATRLQRTLREAEAKAIVYDFEHQEWWLNLLSGTGIGEVEDRQGAMVALARTKVAAYREILMNDRLLDIAVAEPVEQVQIAASSDVPPLSVVLDSYISERGASLTEQVIAAHRAVVADLIAVVGDKRIDWFGREDVRAFKDVVLNLPPNWMKRRELRDLPLADAAKTAKALKLPRQAAKTIQMKQAMLKMIFKYAAENYDDVSNPFSGSPWASAQGPASGQREAFSRAELKLLMSSDLRNELYWLTWLGLCVGARLNELCQLSVRHVRRDPLPHIYFSPELQLKTGKKSANSSVRSVPLHPKLIELGFLKFVRDCESNKDGLLFPNLPLRKTGRFSDAPSKAFRRHLTATGLKRPTLSFHSLRHAFAAEFKRMAPTDVETRERLMGHAVNGVAGRYGNSYEAEANDLNLLVSRAATLRKLDFSF